MAEPLILDTIGQLARALIAQMSPATGTRGTGTMTVTAEAGGGDVTLPRNCYLMPIIHGQQLRTDWLYKTAANPATLAPNGTGGEWVIPDGGTLSVGVLSNLGGQHYNLPAGTALRFDPEFAGLLPTAPLEAAITDASSAGDVIKRANYYEEVTAATVARDLFKAQVTDFPAVAVFWVSSAAVEGRTAGASQGSTRLRRGARFFRETFQIIVANGDNTGDKQRRAAGLTALQAITRLISDRKLNDDGEVLSSVGAGVDIVTRARFTRDANLYVYSMQVRLSQVVEAIDPRTFPAFLQVNIEQALPGREAPEPTDPLVVVDIEDVIP